MGAFFTAVLAKIVTFAAWLSALIVACFAATWILGTDVMSWVFDQVMKVAISALNGFGIDFSIFNPVQYFTALPADMLNILLLIKVGPAFTIILSAIVIKVTLQMIPFTRLGS